MRFYLKKLILSIPGSTISAIITIFFILKERLKIKIIFGKRNFKLFNLNQFKKDLKNPFFILEPVCQLMNCQIVKKNLLNSLLHLELIFFVYQT